MTLEAGTHLHQRYRIERVLGQGGFGAVYLALDEELGLPCAVKENLNPSAQAERQFRREASLLAGLRHPHLPRVTDHFVLAGHQYLVMDYVEGDDLRQRLEQAGLLPEAEAVRWTLQLCDALTYLHTRTPPVLHRDIKPANIKITPAGDAVLVDFGIAKATEAGQKTTTGAAALTPGYAPPEQYGVGRTDARSDQYALAATLYHLLAGQAPPDSVERLIGQARLEPLEARRPGLSAPVTASVAKALQLAPEARFASTAELAQALRGEIEVVIPAAPGTQPAVTIGPAVEGAPAAAAPTAPAHRRPPWLLIAGLSAALLAAGTFGLSGLFRRSAPPSPGALITATAAPPTATRVPPTATRAPTLTPIPPTATATDTAAPSPTPAPTLTPTRSVITALNAGRLERVGTWGRGRLEYVLWSPDDQWLAVMTSRGAAILAAATLQTAAEFPGEAVAAFGPDDLAVLTSPDGRARLIRWRSGESVRDLSAYEVALAAFDAAGRRLAFVGRVTATSQWDGLGVLDLETGALQVLAEGRSAGRAGPGFAASARLRFVADGRYLLADSGLWDLARGRLLRQKSWPGGAPQVSPDEQRLAYEVSVRPSRVVVEGLEKGGFVRDLKLDASSYLIAGENRQTGYTSLGWGFSADSQYLVVIYRRRPYDLASRSYSNEYWAVRFPVAGGPPERVPGRLDLPAGLPDNEAYYTGHAVNGVVGPAGTRFVTLMADQVLRVWGIAGSTPQAVTEPYYFNGQMALSPDGATLAVPHTQGVDLLETAAAVRVRTLDTFLAPLYNRGVTVLPDGVLLVERADSVEFWDIARAALQRRIMLADPYASYLADVPATVVISPDGRWFAHRSKYITLYDLAAGQPRHTFGSANTAHAYAFTPDGQYLAVTSGQAVGLWNTMTGQRDHNLAGHGARIGALSFSPDGTRLISASGDLWEVATGSLIAGFEWGTPAVAVSPDGQLAVGGDGRLVDMNSGATLGTLAGLRGTVLTLAFTADGRRLVVQYDDGVIDIFAPPL